MEMERNMRFKHAQLIQIRPKWMRPGIDMFMERLPSKTQKKDFLGEFMYG